jgi:trehalose 6-phosphate synthase/phosphatase
VSSRLLLVSNRLPVTVVRGELGVEVRPSVGGLATGLRGPHERSGGIWIGWPGDLSGLTDGELVDVSRQLAALRTVAVTMSAAEHEVFYERICNGVLWPLCHDRLDHLPLRVEGWDVYEAMNRRFADAVVAHWREGDTIWVHDYQLLRLPALLRERLPGARIGFFLHIPFPNPEIFFTLPVRAWLVEGVMGADLVGFHTRRYRGHFTAALRRLFGLEMDADGMVAWRGRRVRLGIHPMSVDAAPFAAAAARPEAAVERDALRSGIDGLLVGIDRLDYSKGIPRRLLAFEQLLRTHPEWHGRVRLVQAAVPSRGGVGAYARFRTEVDALVGRINGELGTPTWVPVHYVHRSLPFETLVALYGATDVMLVTPVRDGMNLVAKEFVASRIDDDGVLLLSEFAGAADELTAALIVNPYDVDGVAEAMHRALTMPRDERRRRMQALRTQVSTHDVHRWVDGFLASLAATDRDIGADAARRDVAATEARASRMPDTHRPLP